MFHIFISKCRLGYARVKCQLHFCLKSRKLNFYHKVCHRLGQLIQGSHLLSCDASSPDSISFREKWEVPELVIPVIQGITLQVIKVTSPEKPLARIIHGFSLK